MREGKGAQGALEALAFSVGLHQQSSMLLLGSVICSLVRWCAGVNAEDGRKGGKSFCYQLVAAGQHNRVHCCCCN